MDASKRWIGRFCVVLASSGLAVSATPAQVAFVPIDMMGTAMSGAIMNSARIGAKAGSRQRATPARTDSRLLDYVAVPGRTRANVAAFAAKSRPVDPQGADALIQLFASVDVMAAVDAEMRKVGLSRTNLADAYTVWWTNAWLGTQGRNDDLPRAQIEAVKRQAAAALLATPQLAGLGDAGKQEFAEALLIQAMLVGASIDAAKTQPALMPQTKAAIAKGALAMGIDLSAMTLTEAGFVLPGK